MNKSSFLLKCSMAAVTIAMLAACQHQGRNAAPAEGENSDIIKKEVILSPEAQEMLNSIPTPLEVTRLLQDAKAPYIYSLTNPPENISRYFTEKKKAMAMGVYSIDLAYASIYKQPGDIGKFIYCTGKLADDLGIGGIYDKSLAAKVEAVKDNHDSVLSLVMKAFGEASDFLRRNNRNQVALLAAAGAYAEGLWIASSLCQAATDNAPFANVILGQKQNLDNLLKILGEYGNDETIKPVADEMAKLKPVFSDFGLGSGRALTAQETAGIVRIAGEVRSYMVK
jgi:hypothetical protein